MIYTVKRIEEDLDFGCEERSENQPVMAVVTLADSSGKERKVKAEDAMLYEKKINEGDQIRFDGQDFWHLEKEKGDVEMKISDVTVKMIEFSEGNLHDINHFMKVYAFAKTIAEQEKVSQNQQTTLEIAALVHDIACPFCRKKYGNTNGKFQEIEGEWIARDFLQSQGIPEKIIERVVYLVAHHHTYTKVDGIDYQILLEADYLVNADESDYSKENIENAMSKIFKTKTGIALLKLMYFKE